MAAAGPPVSIYIQLNLRDFEVLNEISSGVREVEMTLNPKS
jgi:hypothetical protein